MELESGSQLVYLASPYSHEDEAVQVRRYREAKDVTAALWQAGYTVISPILYTHDLSVSYGISGGYEEWQRLDEKLIRAADVVLVLMLDGWRESKGIQAELKLARELGKTILSIDRDLVLRCPGG